MLVGLPGAHAEGVRHQPRAGLQPQQRGAQLQVQLGQQIQGDDAGGRQVGLEDVALHDARAIGHAGGPGAALGVRHQFGVELDAQRAGAELPRRGDDDLAVARAQVDDVVAPRHAGHLQHARDQRVGRGHPHHVLAGLKGFGLVGAGAEAGAALRPGGQGARQQGGAEQAAVKRRHGVP